LGTDPNNSDTDGDSYLDGWEITEGTDPTDKDSVIYQGLWPYNPDKDSLGAPDLDKACSSSCVGEKLARFKIVDQFGDMVDIYDFYGSGKPILLAISAQWVPPGNGLASWLSGMGDEYGFGEEWPNLKTHIDNGDIRWMTVLQSKEHPDDPADASTAAEWYADYPLADSPIFASEEVGDHYVRGGWPTVYALDDSLTITHEPNSDSHWAAFDWAEAYSP
jgi:hypothetical protein